MRFFCTTCSKKVSCSHQAFGDVVRHCKTVLHIKFKDEMSRQHKIEKPDDLLKKKVPLFEFRLSRDKLIANLKKIYVGKDFLEASID